jgi:AraC-like DNA-binding protein
MSRSALCELVLDYADRRGIGDVPTPTEVSDLGISRQFSPTGLLPVIYEPVLCVVLSGSKQATFGEKTVTFRQGQSAVIGVDLVTSSAVTEASRSEPYVALALRLNAGIMRELAAEIGLPETADEAPGIISSETDEALLDAMGRLFHLTSQPKSAPVLAPLLVREIHFRLLQDRVGALLRSLSLSGSQASRVVAAMQVIRARFADQLAVPDLARIAGMSISTFHEHFKAVAGTSPLQYQKRLRLMEARRLLATGQNVSDAAFSVGYESTTQFSREFSRYFGATPRSIRTSGKAGDLALAS